MLAARGWPDDQTPCLPTRFPISLPPLRHDHVTSTPRNVSELRRTYMDVSSEVTAIRRPRRTPENAPNRLPSRIRGFGSRHRRGVMCQDIRIALNLRLGFGAFSLGAARRALFWVDSPWSDRWSAR